MKKKLVKGLVICSMIGIGFIALGTNVEAATYYGNGVYCNKQKCWVNWGQAWSEGVKRWGDNLFGSFSGGRI
ncbi:leucocin A/sakacin P family class II bacteriocin [Enterococcus hirae]|uniref:leucocin A/sakacin P family class II bacteriocin n=1 Tax=Enterococcus TaxID=1350 RepID=UPI0009BF4461|nr:leucocin A/sakacin P family class II bacteriocin [Enterococcus hirae]EMF0042435.1 leucocin A/sakacin P family class II bacteriocin [Enterococcus hirae]EMF0136730.1 leucocin A/sakacin P family class II bacteriocin [Enterococcus hirae]EMF0623427.1 leucocin A/sakacin P family class II bacteriocin [Enterococcus hirae]OQO40308.1 bacteriocin [Enterococcus hirae]OQO48662.1 bacteriocin [Enterococcus hirae]